MELLSIGTVAKQAGIRPSAIRYYEAAGILNPPPRKGGQRRYRHEVLVHLAVIRKARDLGFSIADLRRLFGETADDVVASVRWRVVAERKIDEMDALIARTTSMRSLLGESLACDCDTFDTCAMLTDGAHPSGSAR